MKWKLTPEDIVTVLRRRGYVLEARPTQVGITKAGRAKYEDVLYALLPGIVYGFRRYCPENTAEAVFSELVNERGIPTKDDYLSSI